MTKKEEYNPIQGDIFAFLNDTNAAATSKNAAAVSHEAALTSPKKATKKPSGLDLNSDDMFPSLGDASTNSAGSSAWSKQALPTVSIQSNVVTQTFELPPEQQKPIRSESRDKAPKSIGQICQEISGRTRTTIDASTSSKTRAMTFIIRGKSTDVTEAKRQLWAEVAQSMTSPVEVPAEYLGSVIGAGGKILQAIMKETGTKINVPRKSEEYPGFILVTGDYEGVNAAKAKIRFLIDEKQKKLVERIELKAHLLPFIYGVPSSKVNEQAQIWSEHHSIKIGQEIDREKDIAIVTFSGDRDEVRLALNEFNRLLEDQKRNIRSVSTSVPKALHKFLIGPKGSVLLELETETGCSLIIPGADDSSDQITIIGPQSKLFKGLSAVMDKTGSVASETLVLPPNVRELLYDRFRKQVQELQSSSVFISWSTEGLQISGYKTQVPKVLAELENLSKTFASWKFSTFETDPKYFKHIIGKKGQKLQQLQSEHGVYVIIPGEYSEEKQNEILIAGPNDSSVRAAKEQLGSFIVKLEDFLSVEMRVEQKYHRLIIGKGGANISKYSEAFPSVQISFEDDKVEIKGRTAEVKAAQAKLKEEIEALKHESVMHSYTVSIDLDARHITDSKGEPQRWITNITRDHDVKLDVIVKDKKANVNLQGLKKSVEDARQAITERAAALENQGTISVSLDHSYHSMLIGKAGKNVKHLDRRYGVNLKFPDSEDVSNDMIVITGPKQNLESAKSELVELFEQIIAHAHSSELQVPTTCLSRIVGRKGETIETIQLDTDTKIDIKKSQENEESSSTLIVKGTEKGIKDAIKAIKEIVKQAELESSETIDLAPEQTEKVFGTASGAYKALQDSLEPSSVHLSLNRQGSLLVRGARNAVPGAVEQVKNFISSLAEFISVQIEIPTKFHGEIIGTGGKNIQSLSKDNRVKIDMKRNSSTVNVAGLPSDVEAVCKTLMSYVKEERRVPVGSKVLRDQLSASIARDHSHVKCIMTREGLLLQGTPTNLEAAMASLTLALSNQTRSVVSVPKNQQRLLIGQAGRTVKAIREASGADLVVPGADSDSTEVEVIGSPEAIEKAKLEIERILATQA